MAIVAAQAGKLDVAVALREESLINRAREMDPDAWDRIYSDHHESIYRYCFHRLGDRSAAEDVAADVFLEAVRSISRYRYRGVPFRAWLYRIAHHLVVDQVRRRRAMPASIAIAEAPESAVKESDFSDFVLDQTTVKAALAQLTDEQQEVIVLRFFEGLPLADVAAAMGKRTGAIKALQHRAIGRLRRLLAPEGAA